MSDIDLALTAMGVAILKKVVLHPLKNSGPSALVEYGGSYHLTETCLVELPVGRLDKDGYITLSKRLGLGNITIIVNQNSSNNISVNSVIGVQMTYDISTPIVAWWNHATQLWVI